MSEILDIAIDMAKGLFEVGAMDEVTLREVEALGLPKKKAFKPEEIREIRISNHVSQAAFAAIIGVGKTTVQQWEQGQKHPGGAAKRLLDVISRKGIGVLA
ncbi:helix-turn-helix domain-containing protein [Pelodictyon luteolum]|uniref:Transcriptional regulator, XRE family n=1 Tax=Chlorobium luteolum (strain DSM 273 / BCRC 81028 / 2530) TaxID=319225 RepID=Q3B4L5_CHLL3|nr:helix-turn-helix domain-containing protein [Pelodictyon luteolum]ABB23716.1 transcriptional regulator, XRE family [Pelodictyon luteolum DSM 273]